jgi:hypothetical protein
MVHKWYQKFRIAGGTALVTGLLFLSSCMKKESYPEFPEIEFREFTTIFDTTKIAKSGFLTFSFTDGNGDIGLGSGDTLPPYEKSGDYYYNLVIDYYEKQQGQFVKVILDPPFSVRIPYLTPDYPNKAIKGIIVDTMQLNPAPVYDTIKFVFFIYDRALNKSNIDSTPPIILRRH